MVDANHCYTTPDALKVGYALDEHNADLVSAEMKEAVDTARQQIIDGAQYEVLVDQPSPGYWSVENVMTNPQSNRGATKASYKIRERSRWLFEMSFAAAHLESVKAYRAQYGI